VTFTSLFIIFLKRSLKFVVLSNVYSFSLGKCFIKLLGVLVNFEGFFTKKNHVYFREKHYINYILFKIFFIASYNFFPLFWQ